MHPWIVHSPPVTTYGACIVVGLILAWLVARFQSRRASIDPSRIDILVPLVVATGLAGAYLFGNVTDSLIPSAQHGTVLLGSLLVATVAGIVYALVWRIPLGTLGDIMAAPMALGIACGRIGCFFAGCCYGETCNDGLLPGIHFPMHSFAWNAQVASGLIPGEAAASLAVHPVQLYEAALCVLLSVILAGGFDRRGISGERFLFLGIGYALIRFPLEFLRADNPAIGFHLTFSQFLSLFIAAVCVVTLSLRRRYADRLNLRIIPMAV